MKPLTEALSDTLDDTEQAYEHRRESINTRSATTLYRFYDEAGALLYVGITGDTGRRIAQHNREKDWWNHVTNIRIEYHDYRYLALQAERTAIVTEYPMYNVVHSQSRDVVRDPRWWNDKRLPTVKEAAGPSCPRCSTTRSPMDYVWAHPSGRTWHECWTCGHTTDCGRTRLEDFS